MKKFLAALFVLGIFFYMAQTQAQEPVPCPLPPPVPQCADDTGADFLGTEYRCSAEDECGSSVIARDKYQNYVVQQFTEPITDDKGCVIDYTECAPDEATKRSVGDPYYRDERTHQQGTRYQQCSGTTEWQDEPPAIRCQGECYPAPTTKPLNSVPNPPFNVPDGSSYKLPINFAWENLNQIIGPSCQVAYYQIQVPGSGPVSQPPSDVILPPDTPPDEGDPPPPPPTAPPTSCPISSVPECGGPARTQGYSTIHRGLDLVCRIGGGPPSLGMPLYAIFSGTVTTAGNIPDCGKAVEIRNTANTMTARYCHLDTIAVSLGGTINLGQKIGTIGYSGFTVPSGINGTHLHLAACTSPPCAQTGSTNFNPAAIVSCLSGL